MKSTYKGHRFPPEIISHAIWLYHRFTLSFRDVEDLLAERGITVSYEAIRCWCIKFGTTYTRSLRREMEYMRRAKREALEWIATHKAQFVRLTALRFVHFWFGPLHRPKMAVAVSALTLLALLGARRRLPAMTAPQRAAVLIPLATFPLIYYIVGYEFRYRIPIHWLLLLLAGAELWYWIGRRNGECGIMSSGSRIEQLAAESRNVNDKFQAGIPDVAWAAIAAGTILLVIYLVLRAIGPFG